MKPAKVGLVVGIPTRGAISSRWFLAMQELMGWMPNGLKWHTYCYETRAEKPMEEAVCEARTAIVDHALDCGARHLLFLDDDTYPANNVILRLWNARKPICTAVVYTKSDPSMPVIFKEDGMGPWIEVADQKAGVYRIASAGLACCMIHRDVFEKVPKPWFQWKALEEADGATMRVGEDTFFYAKAKAAGIEAFVDSGSVALHAETQFAATGHGRVVKMYPPKEVLDKYVGIQTASLLEGIRQTSEQG